MLRDKLKENVARITWPLPSMIAWEQFLIDAAERAAKSRETSRRRRGRPPARLSRLHRSSRAAAPVRDRLPGYYQDRESIEENSHLAGRTPGGEHSELQSQLIDETRKAFPTQ